MFRFTIRDVLWLTVVVGLGCGWWLDHKRQNAAMSALSESKREAEEKLNRLLIALERRGEKVTFSDMMVGIKGERGAALYGAPSLHGLRRIASPNPPAPAP